METYKYNDKTYIQSGSNPQVGDIVYTDAQGVGIVTLRNDEEKDFVVKYDDGIEYSEDIDSVKLLSEYLVKSWKTKIINYLASLYGFKIGDKVRLKYDRYPYVMTPVIVSFYFKPMNHCWIGAKVLYPDSRGTKGYIYDAYGITGLVKLTIT